MLWQTGFLIYLFLQSTAANPVSRETNFKICENEQCKIAAAIINKAMNKTVDPCEDFYNYACGAWKTNYPLPNNQDVWNLDKMMEDHAINEVKDILEEKEDSEDFAPLKYEKWFYKSCMDVDKAEELGTKPLEETLAYLGGWPIITNRSNWTDENHDWQTIHEYYSSFKDLSSLFDIRVGFDERNLKKNSIKLNKPIESMYENLLRDEDESVVLEKYKNFIKDVVSMFLASMNQAYFDEEITKDIEDVVAFEKNLHLIKTLANENEDLEESRVYMTIEELQDFYDNEKPLNPTAKINWLHVFTDMFKNIDNVEIDLLKEVEVEEKFYFLKLLHLLEETPNRIVVNYVHWKFVASSLKYTNKEMRDLLRQVTSNNKTEDIKPVPERWEECISNMRLRIGYRYEYVKRHFSEDTRKMVIDMVNEMRSGMLDETEHSTWLDDDTKEETMIKLHALTWHIGASNFFTKRNIEHVYDTLTITSNYFENTQNIREFWVNRNLNRLNYNRNPQSYVRIDPLLSKTIYEPSSNILVLTAAQLSVPLIHSTLPTSVNYGYIAPTMGQQMSRTMEKEVDTNVYMTPWSSYLGDTYKSYETKTVCLMRQYNNYSVGPSTVDENMYDAIGLKVAYDAYRYNADDENIEKLSELEELSDDQLFFVSYALKYCQAASPKYQAEHDPVFYTPNEYRVIGTLTNSEYFAKAFGCPSNSPMNPENKCIL